MREIVKNFIIDESGSFWEGFAQAFKDADAKKTREREISDQREYDKSVRSEDRQFQRTMFLDRISADRETARLAHERSIGLLELERGFTLEDRASDREYQDRVRTEDREYDTSVRVSDRAYESSVRTEERNYQAEREDLDRTFRAAQSAAKTQAEKEAAELKYKRELAAAKRKHERSLEKLEKEFELGNRGKLLDATRASGGGLTPTAGGSSKGTTLKVIAKSYPQLDEEKIGQLATNEDALKSVLKKLDEKKKEYADKGEVFTPAMQNNFLSDVVSTARERDDISDDEIQAIADQYGLSPDSTLSGDVTVGDAITSSLMKGTVEPVIDDAAAPKPMSVDEEVKYQKAIETDIIGNLNNQIRTMTRELVELRREGASDDIVEAHQRRLQTARQLVDVMDTGGDSIYVPAEILNTPFGTQAILKVMKRDNRFDPWTLFPDFEPTFNSIEEAEEAAEYFRGSQ